MLYSWRHRYIARVSIFLIALALIAGMVGCGGGVTRYNLTMAVAGGSGTATDLTNASPYTAGTVVSISAVPNQGYVFVNWTAPAGTFGSTTAMTTNFTMPAQNVTVTANFVLSPPAQHNLTISSTAGGLVTTPGEGPFTYDAGTVVNLVAEAGEGYWFVEWTGNVGTIADVYAAVTNITMNGNYSITANFGSEYGNYSDLLNYIITTQGNIDIKGQVNLTYPQGCGPVADYSGAWPTLVELADFYWQDVENATPYASDTIDIAGVNMTKGPLYRNGTLNIKNSSNTPATLKLAGTLYITGDILIGMTNKDFTLDLNGQTIFVSSNTTGSQKALNIGTHVSIKGPGCIIAVGDIYYEPKSQIGTEPIFILSVSGTTLLQPGGNIYGAVAGSVAVEIQVNTSLTYPIGGFGSFNLNFPC